MDARDRTLVKAALGGSSLSYINVCVGKPTATIFWPYAVSSNMSCQAFQVQRETHPILQNRKRQGAHNMGAPFCSAIPARHRHPTCLRVINGRHRPIGVNTPDQVIGSKQAAEADGRAGHESDAIAYKHCTRAVRAGSGTFLAFMVCIKTRQALCLTWGRKCSYQEQASPGFCNLFTAK